MKKERPPKWEKWRYIPTPKLWECVALSLNIEPDKVRHSPHSWMAGEHLFEESDEFQDRVDVGTRNLSSLSPTSWNGRNSTVPLATFSKWAISIHWEIPSELAELADSSSSQSDTEVAAGGNTLSSSDYWKRLEKMATRSINEFPAWRENQRKIQKTGNLQEWLVHDIGGDSREAAILKKILSDFFQELS